MSDRFIVAEVSKNWIDGRELTTEAGLVSQRFEHVVNVNAARGYRLVTFALDRLMTGPRELNETIIAVFERVARSCDDYRPDHNGECLTADDQFVTSADTLDELRRWLALYGARAQGRPS